MVRIPPSERHRLGGAPVRPRLTGDAEYIFVPYDMGEDRLDCMSESEVDMDDATVLEYRLRKKSARDETQREFIDACNEWLFHTRKNPKEYAAHASPKNYWADMGVWKDKGLNTGEHGRKQAIFWRHYPRHVKADTQGFPIVAGDREASAGHLARYGRHKLRAQEDWDTTITDAMLQPLGQPVPDRIRFDVVWSAKKDRKPQDYTDKFRGVLEVFQQKRQADAVKKAARPKVLLATIKRREEKAAMRRLHMVDKGHPMEKYITVRYLDALVKFEHEWRPENCCLNVEMVPERDRGKFCDLLQDAFDRVYHVWLRAVVRYASSLMSFREIDEWMLQSEEQKFLSLIWVFHNVDDLDADSPIPVFFSDVKAYADHTTMTLLEDGRAEKAAARDALAAMQRVAALDDCPFTARQLAKIADQQDIWDQKGTFGHDMDRDYLVSWYVDLIGQAKVAPLPGQGVNEVHYSRAPLLRQFEEELNGLREITPEVQHAPSTPQRRGHQEGGQDATSPRLPSSPPMFSPSVGAVVKALTNLWVDVQRSSPSSLRGRVGPVNTSDDGLEEFDAPKEKFDMVICNYCWNQMRYYPFNRCELGPGGTCTECSRVDRKQSCKWEVSTLRGWASICAVLTGFIDAGGCR